MRRLPDKSREQLDAAGGVLEQLARLRRRLRVLLLVDGTARVIAVASIAFLAIGVVDYWLVLPWLLRTAIATSLLIGLLAMTDRRIVRPLINRIPLREIASRLARRTHDADRLASLVDRAEGHAAGAPELWQRVDAEARAAVAAQPIESVMNARRPLKAVACGSASLLAVLVLSLAAPGWMHTAWHRLIWPPGAAAWPTRVGIEPLTRSSKVARGEPYITEMRITRGGDPDLRAFLVVAEKDRPTQRLMMRLDSDGTYRRTIECVTADTRFWFESGDASTAATPDILRVVDRPAVRRMTADVTPPPYVRNGKSWTESLDDRRIAVVQGSKISVIVDATKPPRRDAAGNTRAVLRFDDGTEVPLASTDAEPTRLRGDFVADAARRFEVAMVDRDGLTSGPQQSCEVEVKPDDPPSVAIVRPPAAIEAAPIAEVSIRVTAEDDFRLKSLALECTIADHSPVPPFDLLAAADVAPAAARVTIDHVMRLADLKVKPGDTIEYRAVAADDAEQAGKPRDPVRTPLSRIRVVEAADLAERIRADQTALHAQIRTILAAEEVIRDRTTAAMNPALQSEDADDTSAGTLESLGGQQRGVIARARQLAAQFNDIADRIRANGLKLEDLSATLPATSRELAEIADGPMTAANSLLAQAAQAPATARGDSVTRALASESDAIARLNRLLESAGELHDVPDVVRKLRELLDRQEALARTGSDLAKRTAGVANDRLPAAEREQLAQSARDQERLADEARRAVKRIGELASVTKDRAAATALQRAYGAADGAGVADKMADAARQLNENRTSRAVDLQHEAETALRSVLAALEQAPLRQLEELTKQLADLNRRLDRLIAAQQRLIDENRAARADNAAAGPSKPADESADRLRRQAERQSTLATTTSGLTRRPEPSGENGETVRKTLANASGHMKDAATKLDSGDEKPALDEQRTALDSLKQARDQLNKLEDKAAEELSQRSLDAIRDELVRIRNEQEKLRGLTRALPAGAANRAIRLRATSLAGQQSKLATPLEAVKKRMGGAIVYVYVCDAILARMKQSADALKAAKRDQAVTDQTRIVQDLSRLIDAIAQLRRQRDDARFAESAAAGGQGESGTPDRPVPPIAELRVLRLLQSELNDHTADAARDPAANAEGIQDLAAQQRDLLDLAKKMMERARAQQEKP